MRFSSIAILTIGAAYALERPAEEGDQENSIIDRKKVIPTKVKDPTPLSKEEKREPNKQKMPIEVDPAQKIGPWLGVSGEPASPTLKTHLGIDSGFVLRIVAENSPASLGGLKEYDIIIKVNDTSITGQPSLAEIINAHEPGNVVQLKVISGGKETSPTITLGARAITRTLQEESLGQLQQPAPSLPPSSERAESSAPRSKKGLGRTLLEMGFKSLLKEADPSNSFNMDFKSVSTIRILDQDGSVEIDVLNGEKQVTVKDKQGNVEYQGPWNSVEDKMKASPEIKDRVENIDFKFLDRSLQFGNRNQNEIK